MLTQPTIFALLAYIGWLLLLLSLIAIYRSGLVLGGKRSANSFQPTGDDGTAFSQRLCRAHANCYESFPFVGGLLLLAIASGQTAVTDPLALPFIAARLGQSLIHLVSTAAPAVLARFALMLVQVAIAITWLFGLGRALLVG